MRHILIALAFFVFGTAEASAQSSCQYIAYGVVLTAAQWNACFGAKQDYLGFVPLNPSSLAPVAPVTITPTLGVIQIGLGYNTSLTVDGSSNLGFNLSHSNTFTAAQIISSNAIAAFAVGPNGATNPTLAVRSDVPSAVTGIQVVSEIAGSGAYIEAMSSVGTETLYLDGKGAGGIELQFIGTGPITLHAPTSVSGLLATAASATSGAGFNLPQGSAPTSPNNGDVWTTSTGIFVRINGVSVGPLAAFGGGVSSVGLAMPGIFSVSGSPVTSSGTLTATLTTETANTVFAGPTTGGPATPTFRQVVAADIATVQGNGTLVQLAAGTPTNGHCVQYDASGNTVDAGIVCGGSGGSAVIVANSTVTSAFTSGDLLGTASNLVTDSGIAYANVMTLSGPQTVSGIKTYSANQFFENGIYGNTTAGGVLNLFSTSNGSPSGDSIAMTSTQFFAGQNGATNPAFRINATATGAGTGVELFSYPAGSGVYLEAVSSGSPETIYIDGKGAGGVTLQAIGTGAINLDTGVNVHNALTMVTTDQPISLSGAGSTLTGAGTMTITGTHILGSLGSSNGTYQGGSTTNPLFLPYSGSGSNINASIAAVLNESGTVSSTTQDAAISAMYYSSNPNTNPGNAAINAYCVALVATTGGCTGLNLNAQAGANNTIIIGAELAITTSASVTRGDVLILEAESSASQGITNYMVIRSVDGTPAGQGILFGDNSNNPIATNGTLIADNNLIHASWGIHFGASDVFTSGAISTPGFLVSGTGGIQASLVSLGSTGYYVCYTPSNGTLSYTNTAC